MNVKLSKTMILSFIFLAGAAPGRARAQNIAAAKEIFVRAMDQMADGNYSTACPGLAESHRLDPRPGTLFMIAVCYDRWGKIATAVAIYEEFLREYSKMQPDIRGRYTERAAKAEPRRLELAPQVPRLKLILPPDSPRDVEIQRNGVEISAASLDVSLPMDPGEHVVTTQVANGPVVEKRITLDRGERKEITLEIKLPKPPEPGPPPPELAPKARAAEEPAPIEAAESGSARRDEPREEPVRRAPRPLDSAVSRAPSPAITGRRIGAMFMGGIGLSGLILGGVGGVLVLQKKAVIQAHCEGSLCDAEGMAAANGASLPSALSSIGFGLGAVGITSGVILWLTEPSASAATAIRPGLRTVAAFDRSGAFIGVKGAW